MALTIDVAITSWPNHPRRIEYITQVLESLRDRLSAGQHDLRFYCSAETERDPEMSWHAVELVHLCQRRGIELGWRIGEANLGANMNAAMAMGTGEFVCLQQDDWWLKEPLDLSPGADLLTRHRDLDLVRYSWPDGDDMRPTFAGDIEGWRLIDPRGRWPYGDDPHLRRRDFMDKWGWYYEGGRHGSASGELMKKLATGGFRGVVADKVYYEHKGRVSAVVGDVRSGKNRRYEEQ